MRTPKVARWSSVIVEWTDSCGPTHGWHHPESDEHSPAQCVTSGQVFAQDTSSVTLVLSRTVGDDAVDGLITIPKVAITSFTALVPA